MVESGSSEYVRGYREAMRGTRDWEERVGPEYLAGFHDAANDLGGVQ